MAGNDLMETTVDFKTEFDKFAALTENRLARIETQLEKIYLLEAKVNRLYEHFMH